MISAFRVARSARVASHAPRVTLPFAGRTGLSMYSDKAGKKGYDSSTMQEAPPDEGDTAMDEDAQTDAVLKGGSGSFEAKRNVEAGGPGSKRDTSTASQKDPASKAEAGPLGPSSGDSPSSTT